MDQKAFLRTDEIVCGIAEPEWCSLYITLEISKTGLSLICSLVCIFDFQEIFLANVILFCFKCNLFGESQAISAIKSSLGRTFSLVFDYRILLFQENGMV